MSKPNVVFILADDLGYGDFSAFNGGLSSTPTLDGLMREGVCLTQHYTASPVCNPLRRGFDETVCFRGGMHDYWHWRVEFGRSARRSDGRYLTDLWTEEAVGFIGHASQQVNYLEGVTWERASGVLRGEVPWKKLRKWHLLNFHSGRTTGWNVAKPSIATRLRDNRRIAPEYARCMEWGEAP